MQEQLQSRNGGSPTYELLGSSGPAHAREFEVAVHHAGRELGRGSGGSKKEAESRAAMAASRETTNRRTRAKRKAMHERKMGRGG